MSENDTVKKAFDTLLEETTGLLYSSKLCEEKITSGWSERFFRKYVSKNKPVVLRGAAKNLTDQALQKWSPEYLIKKLGEKKVSVALTPNGYADGLNTINGHQCFVLPEEKKMPIGDFFELLRLKKENVVAYIQKQNSNLVNELPELLNEVCLDISWANKAFGGPPEAVNFWMGDERAISSLHKDHYENIYIVVDGYKDFILIPPTDLPYIKYKKFKMKQYKNVQESGFEIDDFPNDEEYLNWIAVDPLNKEEILEKYPDFLKAHRYEVRINKGDVLYLPSLWFHHVRQSHQCIAINYWYDMDFDIKYCYFKLLERLCGID